MSVLGANERDTAQGAADDVKGAIRMGKNTAKTAKTVTKAASQAASGNVAGAVVSILKDPETMKKLLIIILIPVLLLTFIMIFFLYALPTAIFEAVLTFMDNVKEAYEMGIVSGEYGGSFLAGLAGVTMALGDWASDWISNLFSGFTEIISSAWNGVKSFFFGTDEEQNQTEKLTDEKTQIQISSQEASEKLAVITKAVAANKKYEQRAKQVVDAINGKANSITNGRQSIDDKMYEDNCGPHEVWVGTTINCTMEPIGTADDSIVDALETKLDDISNARTPDELKQANEEFSALVEADFPRNAAGGYSNTEALSMMSLLTVQQGASLLDMKMSDFIKYLGWYKSGNGDHTSIDVGHCNSTPYTTNVQSWKGTFKPQYLMEEYNYYVGQKNLLQAEKEFGTATNEDLARLDEIEGFLANYSADGDYGVPLMDLLIVLDFPDLDYEGGCETNDCPAHGDTCTATTYTNPKGKSTLSIHHYSITEELADGSTITTYYCRVIINSYVVPRGTANIVSKAGLWNGSLENIQTQGDSIQEEDAN